MINFIFLIKDDFERWSKKPGLFEFLKILFLAPGFQLILIFRVARSLKKIPLLGNFLSKIIMYFSKIYFSCDIDINAKIKGGLYFPHPIGIVIGGRVDIGKGVTILQNVTIGNRGLHDLGNPTIQDGVSINAGACVLGSIDVGARATIGANSVVISNIPAGCVAVGVPSRVIDKIR